MRGMIDLETSIAEYDILLSVSPEFVADKAEADVGFRGRVFPIGMGIYRISSAKQERMTDESQIEEWMSDTLRSGIEDCAVSSPRELATLLGACEGRSLGYVVAYDAVVEGAWHLYLDERRTLPLDREFLGGYQGVGGWIIDVRNPLGAQPFEGLEVPVLYQEKSTQVESNKEVGYHFQSPTGKRASLDESRTRIVDLLEKTRDARMEVFSKVPRHPVIQGIIGGIDRTHEKRISQILEKLR